MATSLYTIRLPKCTRRTCFLKTLQTSDSTRSAVVSHRHSAFKLHVPVHYNLLGFIPVLRLNLFCSQVLMIAPSLSLLISPVI
jgi:hypothetical protein